MHFKGFKTAQTRDIIMVTLRKSDITQITLNSFQV